jgi:hypothetical protein
MTACPNPCQAHSLLFNIIPEDAMASRHAGPCVAYSLYQCFCYSFLLLFIHESDCLPIIVCELQLTLPTFRCDTRVEVREDLGMTTCHQESCSFGLIVISLRNADAQDVSLLIHRQESLIRATAETGRS